MDSHAHHDHAAMNHPTATLVNVTAQMVTNAAMDHGSHGHHQMGDSMMMMYFHGGYEETILFNFWETSNVGIFVLSCIILFIAAALYEGLKLLRETLIRNEILSQTVKQEINSTNKKSKNPNNNNAELLLNEQQQNTLAIDLLNSATADATVISKSQAYLFQKRSRLLSRSHLVQTFLHMLQVTISYLLMLVFMTYNSWLCLSVILGAGSGYFFFGFKRLTTIDVNEHCH